MFKRYPFVRQHEDSDCGAAALAAIALYYGYPIGLQKLRDLCLTDRAGTSMRELHKAAAKIGFIAKGIRCSIEDLKRVPLPAIVQVKNREGHGHFVTLYRVTSRSLTIADPARDLLKISIDDFRETWTGIVLLVEPRHNLPHLDSQGVSKPWHRYWLLLRGQMSLLMEAFLCGLVLTVLGLGTSFFIQHLVDSVLVRGEARLLNALASGMVLVIILKVLFAVLRQYLLAFVSKRVDLSLISSYAQHVLRLPMRFFESRQVGQIIARVGDASKVREVISGTTLTAVSDGVLVTITMAALWLYDIKLAMMATLFVPVLVLLVLTHHPITKRRARESMEHSADLYAHLIEDVSGVDTVKAYNIEKERTEQAESRIVKLAQTTFSLEKIAVSMGNIGHVSTEIAGIVILWYGSFRVMDGALTIGQLMFFYTLLGHMLQPLQRLASLNLEIQDGAVALDRLCEVMEVAQEPFEIEGQAHFNGVTQDIVVQDVSFSYGQRGDVLSDIQLRIAAGLTVAIVGGSGSGKSTLLKLLMRFYEPTQGRIMLDGMDMRDFDLSSLRSRIGLVPQDPYIFNCSIRDNITLGRAACSMEEIAHAARAAELDEFISDLPDRYDTIIGERGTNLSGGQRQRLAIARALLRCPDILIFDEATSHLDTATEQAIQRNLKTFLSGRTVVLVAHRLSTIKDADIIYVLHDGRVVEEGGHWDLMSVNGQYAALWRAQTEKSAKSNTLYSNGSHLSGGNGTRSLVSERR